MITQNLPISLDAEQATLGSLLLNRDAIIVVAPFLETAHFYQESHAIIFAAILACYQRRVPPDIRTVYEELRRNNHIDVVGGMIYLNELVSATPTSHHVEYYARIVERTALSRRLIMVGSKIASVGYQEDLDTEDAIVQAQAVLTEATVRKDDSAIAPIEQAIERVVNAIERGVAPGIETGFYDYDRLTGGLHPGNLVVLGGRPGQGKTSFATAIAYNLLLDGQPVLFFSLEMTSEEIAQRLIAMRSGVDLVAIRQHALDSDQMTAFYDASGSITSQRYLQRLYIDDSRPTVTDIRARALRFLSEHGRVGLVIVDYLQLVKTPSRRNGTRAEEVGEISHALKALSKELKCTVLALAQLNRELDKRGDGEPELSDLRESGDIEADADQVVFVTRPEMHDESAPKGTGLLHIKKHRAGPLGRVELLFDAKSTRFKNLDRHRIPEGY